MHQPEYLYITPSVWFCLFAVQKQYVQIVLLCIIMVFTFVIICIKWYVDYVQCKVKTWKCQLCFLDWVHKIQTIWFSSNLLITNIWFSYRLSLKTGCSQISFTNLNFLLRIKTRKPFWSLVFTTTWTRNIIFFSLSFKWVVTENHLFLSQCTVRCWFVFRF